MSVASETVTMRASGGRGRNLYYWLVSGAALVTLSMGVLSRQHELLTNGLRLLPWIALLVTVNLLPLSGWPHAILAPDLAIGTAAALVLDPVEMGLVHFLGAFDRQELQRHVDLPKALFNRSQVALATAASSFVVHTVSTGPTRTSAVLPLAFLALGTNTTLNYAFVALAIRFEYRLPIPDAIQRMRIGTLADFALAFTCWGVLGAMLAALYDQVHPWALLAFLGPTLLTRQALRRSEMFLETRQAYRSRERTLHELHQRIADERTDERRLIAADLHDDVLQPLFQVTLLAQVLKTELTTGRLLELDQDLPELLTAAEVTASSLRDLIGVLRRSDLGRGGLAPALTSFVRRLREATELEYHVELRETPSTPTVDLVIYQVAKEALGNAGTHSRATTVWLELRATEQGILLRVEDNGIGFDPTADRSGHFGIAIMRERAAAVGAQLFIDAAPGHGCSVKLLIPPRSGGLT